MKTLFSSAHLSAIHSKYYGDDGIQAETLKKYPLYAAVFKLMPTDETNHFKCDADTHAMKLALAGYMVNFSNMSKKSNRFYKLLNNLLQVLLKIHLAPTRERRYKDFIAQKKQEKIERHGTSQKLVKKSRSSLRRFLKKERAKQEYYQQKVSQDHEQRSVWEEKVVTCKQRILDFEENTMKEIQVSEDEKAMELEVASEIELDYIEDIEDQDDEQEQLKDSDLSRRRLFTLQSIIRGLLLKSGKKSISVQDLKDTSNDLEDKEISVCMLIFNLIAPYIPDHKNRGSFAYQLPFLLMCNQIFLVTEYFKFVVKLCPIIKPGSLSSLQMDAAGLYSLFSSQKVKEKPLRVFDHNNQEITSKQAATEQKDAMFGSYFNLPKVFQRLARYRQDFQHYMIFLPGLQTVRLMGEIKKPHHANGWKVKRHPLIKSCSKKINKLKEKRDELQQKVFLLSNKKELGKEIYYLNRRVGVNNKEDEEDEPAVKKKLISYSNYKCMEKTENLKIDEELLNGNLCMSGTDNGIVTMTETCKLDLEKFKYHLKLYNRYDALENEVK
ncbi:hypothetical protein EDC94DRAFT_607444 [Helicostylum pulchrum]|nr:hypothetical protein EDC94DRAFT_607444 [Helicostylum pulchrum]